MKWLQIIFVLPILLLSFSLTGQNKQIDKANKRYQIKKYAEAIPLYEQGLEKNSSLSAQTKLAYCYRVNNNVEKAAALYGEIVLNKRARPITWYYYGESLIGQGKYEEAKEWLKKYTNEKPKDKKGWTLLESVDKVQKIEPYFLVENVNPFSQNSDSDESAAIFFKDGIAFSSDRKTGVKMMKKKSGWTGRDFLSLYFSKQNSDGTYKSPSQLSRRLNDMNKNTGTITVAPDGTHVVFSRNSDISNRKNAYNLMLYRADLTADGKFKNVKMLSFCGNNVNYMHPTFSADGNTLYFTSDKKGEGGTDIFYVERKGDNGWTRPINVGAPVNTSANEGFPFMSHDGKLYFCSKGHVSYGGFDILMTEKDEKGNWKHPINVGKPINSSADDISIFIAPDGQKGIFASSREGGDDDIYFFDILGTNAVSSSGFNDQPMTQNISTDQTEMALESTPKENSETESSLPFEPIEPFKADVEEKIEIANTKVEQADIEKTNAVTQEDLSKISSNSELPFEPIEPFKNNTEEKIDVANSKIEQVAIEKTNPANEENLSKISSNSELPFEPIEPFKNNTEEKIDVANSKVEQAAIEKTNAAKEDNLSKISSDTSAPLEPINSIKEKVEEKVKKNPVNKTNVDSTNSTSQTAEDVFEIRLETLQQLEAESTKFEEGLASSEQSMADEIPIKSEDQGLTEIKDYLSHSTNEREAIFVLEKLKFDPNEYVVNANSDFSSDLEELFNLLVENPTIKIEVSAHTESIGVDHENMVISIKRATAIAGFLIRKGISTDRVKVMGFGETQLLNHCSNNVNCSPEEHALNQRIEIQILE